MVTDSLQLGLELTALAIFVCAFALFLTGGSDAVGQPFRLAIEPLLADLRARTARSRAELADTSILVSIGFAVLAALAGQAIGGAAVALMLWWGRPVFQRLTREDNRLMASMSLFSIDMVIGLFVPIALAQLLLSSYFLAFSTVLVVVALSWPAGTGGGGHGRPWKLTPVRPD
ncbi:MAG: hypothetical protein ACFCVK_08235 [Acidimicrobiales bacterium]